MAASWSFRRRADAARRTTLDQPRRAREYVARLSPISRFVVADESMMPAFVPGERIVVSRLAYLLRPPRTGDVIVVRDPQDASRRLLKRIAEITDEGRLDVRGDNAAASRDSRSFGAVPRNVIVGKVWFKY